MLVKMCLRHCSLWFNLPYQATKHFVTVTLLGACECHFWTRSFYQLQSREQAMLLFYFLLFNDHVIFVFESRHFHVSYDDEIKFQTYIFGYRESTVYCILYMPA